MVLVILIFASSLNWCCNKKIGYSVPKLVAFGCLTEALPQLVYVPHDLLVQSVFVVRYVSHRNHLYWQPKTATVHMYHVAAL